MIFVWRLEVGVRQERTLGEVLAERHWTPVMLALVADIGTRTAHRIIAGESRPRGTTAIRIAEGLGIGYERMRRILAATWEAGHAAQASQVREAEKPLAVTSLLSARSPIAAAGPPPSAAGRDSSLEAVQC